MEFKTVIYIDGTVSNENPDDILSLYVSPLASNRMPHERVTLYGGDDTTYVSEPMFPVSWLMDVHLEGYEFDASHELGTRFALDESSAGKQFTHDADEPTTVMISGWQGYGYPVYTMYVHLKEEGPSGPVITTETETYTEPIPYETEEQNTEELFEGETNVVQEGIDGEYTITEEVTYADGEETDRVELERNVTTEPVTEIIEVGIRAPIIEVPVTTAPPEFTASTYELTIPAVEGITYSSRDTGEPLTGTIDVREYVEPETPFVVQAEASEHPTPYTHEYIIQGDTEWSYEYEPEPEGPEVTTETITETRPEPYQVVEVPNPDKGTWDRTVTQEGVVGERVQEILITYHDGVEHLREIVSDVVTKEPVDRVIEVGTNEAIGEPDAPLRITLYNTIDDANVMNKSKEIIGQYDIVLKDISNVSTPVIRLKEELSNLDEIANYAYLDKFNRYYYISTMTSSNHSTWILNLSVDVIESFKNDILNSNAEITRHMQEGDYLDVTPYREVRKEVDVFKSSRQFMNEDTILFSTIGQKIEEE